ncbi:MAG TPA: LysM peptidoglycan-binding domain-containing protein [Ilumatobacteraceae bacterium]|nr:LysM peptidoglycan-binding domain-containing protein [Ilumatobacteraceae bacterium]
MSSSARLAVVLVVPVVLLAAACKGDPGQERIASAAGDISVVTQADGSSVATQAYTVVSGDSLWAISQQFCTSVPVLVQLNAYADGDAHPLFPDDTVVVPAGLCSGNDGGDNGGSGSTTTAAGGNGDGGQSGGTTTTGASTKPTTPQVATEVEVEQWLDQRRGFAPDPMLGDPTDYNEDFGRKCQAAWNTTLDFEKGEVGTDDVLAVLDPLPGSVPDDVRASIAVWVKFNDTWYSTYRNLVEDYSDNTGTTDYDALVEDRDYRDFLAHWLPIAADQAAAHDYATQVCTDQLQRKGSTP